MQTSFTDVFTCKRGVYKTLVAVIVSASMLMATASWGDIYFNAKVAGPVTNIYAANRQGSIHKLTDNNAWRDLAPSISREGSVVFTSNREPNIKIDLQRHSENLNIYIADTKTKQLRQLTDSPEHDISPRFSPDGKWIAYLKVLDSRQRELRLITPDNSNKHRLLISGHISDFAWSSDSQQIAFTNEYQDRSLLSVVDIKHGKLKHLAYTAIPDKATAAKIEHLKGAIDFQTHLTAPQWSPDGKFIAYIKHPLTRNTIRELFVLDLASGKHTKVSLDSMQAQAPIIWSQDSKQLLYSALVGYQYHYDEQTHRKIYKGAMHIFLSELNGKTQQMTTGNHLHSHPVFSPDEKDIAYLYADKLGDARTLSLRVMDIRGQYSKELYNSVARQSSIVWQ